MAMIGRKAHAAKLTLFFDGRGFGPPEAAQGRKYSLRFSGNGERAIQKCVSPQFFAHGSILAPETPLGNKVSP
jgi:hypothetical protein